jgi:hypothetical protein
MTFLTATPDLGCNPLFTGGTLAKIKSGHGFHRFQGCRGAIKSRTSVDLWLASILCTILVVPRD